MNCNTSLAADFLSYQPFMGFEFHESQFPRRMSKVASIGIENKTYDTSGGAKTLIFSKY
jgi:hypothetical protein